MSKLLEMTNRVALGQADEWEVRTVKKVSLVGKVLNDLIKQDVNRIGLVGPHCSGKSLVSCLVTDRPVHHGDDWSGQGWSSEPMVLDIIALNQERYFLEGCNVARGILRAHEAGFKLVDALIVIDASLKSNSEMKPGHRGQAAGILTSLKKCIDTGALDGVTIIHV